MPQLGAQPRRTAGIEPFLDRLANLPFVTGAESLEAQPVFGGRYFDATVQVDTLAGSYQYLTLVKRSYLDIATVRSLVATAQGLVPRGRNLLVFARYLPPPSAKKLIEAEAHFIDLRGTVTKLTDFGAFVAIADGIEGLVHVSDLSWVKRVRHPKEILAPGDEMEVKILAYDLEHAKLSLGLKQLLANPWDDVPELYPVGRRITARVSNLVSFGAFLNIEDAIDGLLHVEDMSWTERVADPSTIVKVGDEIEVMVLHVDPRQRRIKLGLKQLAEDPWTTLARAYKKGSEITGTVSRKADFGVFVTVEGDLEGLISKNHLPDGDTSFEEASKGLKLGDPIQAIVLEINPQSHRLALSVRELRKRQVRAEMLRYAHADNSDDTVPLGDMLRRKSSG